MQVHWNQQHGQHHPSRQLEDFQLDVQLKHHCMESKIGFHTQQFYRIGMQQNCINNEILPITLLQNTTWWITKMKFECWKHDCQTNKFNSRVGSFFETFFNCRDKIWWNSLTNNHVFKFKLCWWPCRKWFNIPVTTLNSKYVIKK